MIRATLLAVAIGFFVSLSEPNAAEPPATPSRDTADSRPTPNVNAKVADSIRVLRYTRIVRDLAALDISQLGAPQTGAWIIAKIHPGDTSGRTYAQGLYIEAETGKVIDRGIRPIAVIMIDGKWALMELLSGKAPREGAYQWKEPTSSPSNRWVSILNDESSVFKGPKNDGTVICHFFADKSGAEQFADVTLIPDGWEIFVKPAYEHYLEHAAGLADDTFCELKKTALSDNPLIGLTAIRHIVDKAGAAENTDACVDLARSLPKYRQAVFIVRLLKKNDDDLRDIVSKAVGQATNASELPGMALGLYCSFALRPDAESERGMLDKLTERWKSLDPHTADDMSLNRLLLAPGVQQGDPTSRKE